MRPSFSLYDFLCPFTCTLVLRGNSTILPWGGTGPVFPSAATNEGQGQHYAALSSVLYVVREAIDINADWAVADHGLRHGSGRSLDDTMNWVTVQAF